MYKCIFDFHISYFVWKNKICLIQSFPFNLIKLHIHFVLRTAMCGLKSFNPASMINNTGIKLLFCLVATK